MPGPYDDFQRRASQIGKAFATWCEVTLQSIGFILQGKTVIKEAGVEIDQVAKNRNGESLYFQFKGSSKPPGPGMQRSDTVKKALCDAFLLDKLGIGPYIVITSHKPKSGTSSEKMIQVAKDVLFDLICISDDRDFERLESYTRVLPWRSRTAAKQQAKLGASPRSEAVGQQSLFNIGTLQHFTEDKDKPVKKAAKKKRAV
jgi:hypothetical protein